MATNDDLFGNAARAKNARKEPVEARKTVKAAAPPGEEGYTAASIEVLEGLEPVRRRPGMYIGGTDETALHHLFAEVLDNAMDEAVAGFANRIEVVFEADGFLCVTDNGRGIPVDPHPKFPKKSALEVIMCMLHSGGKFDSGAYQTSGGLHGVGVSVVNALSERLEVEVARAQTLYRQVFERGAPDRTNWRRWAGSPIGAAPRCGSGPIRRSSQGRRKFRPARLFKMARAKAYLFGGVEIRWKCAPELLDPSGKTPTEAVFHFPGGLKDYLAADIEGKEQVSEPFFVGRIDKAEATARWNGRWPGSPIDDGFMHSYCNTIPTPDGGTHEAACAWRCCGR